MFVTDEVKTYPEPSEGLAQSGCSVGKHAYLFVLVGNIRQEVT
jgi:hypothetical protein